MTGRRREKVRAWLTTPVGLLAPLLLLVLVGLSVVGPHGFDSSATQVNMLEAGEGPSATHLLGTDSLGRDILLRTLAATRISILLGAASVAAGALVGCLLGALLAIAPERVRRLGAGLLDLLLSFGDILLAIVILAILGIGASNAVIAVAVAFTPAFARFTYSLVSSVRARDYVAAARVVGVPRRAFLGRYVFRNISDSLAVTCFSLVGQGILAFAALSFLGLGVQEPHFDWGQMLTAGIRDFYLNAWAAFAPALMIAVTGITFSLFGDALARVSNPLLRGHVAPDRVKGTP
jgi:peptide/nickel transport system permease protein